MATPTRSFVDADTSRVDVHRNVRRSRVLCGSASTFTMVTETYSPGNECVCVRVCACVCVCV